MKDHNSKDNFQPARTEKPSGGKGCSAASDRSEHLGFIEVQTRKRKRMWLKTVSLLVAFVFFVQQVTYSWDYSPAPAPASSVSTERLGDDLSVADEGIEVTNYDMFSRQREGGIAEQLLPSASEGEQARRFAPSYIKRQQQKHEEIIRQRMGRDTMMERQFGPAKEYSEPVPLKKKKSSGGAAGGMYYTLEDYSGGAPMQLNEFVYQDGAAWNRMTEMVSYDISGLSTGEWTQNAREMETDDGDTYVGSYRRLENRAGLDDKSIISRTVYFGNKGEERVDYVLSSYDEQGIPGEVTVYDYGPGNDALRFTITYNITDLAIDFGSSGWKDALDDSHVVRKTVYEGAKDEEKVSYMLDTYVIDDFGANNPNKVTIYDYEGKTLKETRSYYVTDLPEEDWLTEEDRRLESVTVYEGEEDKETMKYTLSYFFPEGEGESIEYVPWERKDYVYTGRKMTESLTYDISDLGSEEGIEKGAGVLEEHAFFKGDKNHERLDYTYSLYSNEEVPQLRSDYEYYGRALRYVRTYDLAGLAPEAEDLDFQIRNNTDLVQDVSVYAGKASAERILSTTSYYADGSTFKETLNEYERNTRGRYYIAHSTARTYSESGEVIERVETANSIYFDFEGRPKEDLNANIRVTNLKTYFTFFGEEILDREEDAVLSRYTAQGQPGYEERTMYVYDEDRNKIPVEFREVTNHAYNPKGSVISQTINSYTQDEIGDWVYDRTKEIENHRFDYYGNVYDSSETVWLVKDEGARLPEDLFLHKTIRNEYDDLMARRKGTATLTEVTRYNSLMEIDANKIDRTLTTTSEFDIRGYAVRQATDTFVMDRITDPARAEEKLASRRESHNLDLDPRGDAGTQRVTTYTTDRYGNILTNENGDPIPTTYQESTNRKFDSQHNVLNQINYTYTDPSASVLLDVQEIRSSGFHPSGVALRQVTATYSDIDKTDLLGVQVVTNSNISTDGDVGKTVITNYADAVIADGGTGEITY
jgi:hypothetical protein